MGTTGIYEKPVDVKAFMDGLYSWESDTGTRRVLKSAIVNRTEYYAAIEHVAPNGTRTVWAGAAILSYGGRNDPCKFYYKGMDETVGPRIRNCPASILDLLTEAAPGYAEKWRQDCRDRLARRERNKPLLRPGGRFKLPDPLMFGDGVKRDSFETIQWRTGVAFRCLTTGICCKISRVRERELIAL